MNAIAGRLAARASRQFVIGLSAAAALMLGGLDAHAASMTQGGLTVNIRDNNGAVDSVVYGGKDFFGAGTAVSDWGLSGLGFGIRGTNATTEPAPTTVAGSAGKITVNTSYAGFEVIRTYRMLTGIDVLRVTTTLINHDPIQRTIRLFDAFDPDQDAPSTFSTRNDVLTLGGTTVAQAKGPLSDDTSIIGSSVSPAVTGFLSGLGIFSASGLNTFMSSPADPNNALADRGYAIAHLLTVDAGDLVRVRHDHAFGGTMLDAQAAFLAAQAIADVPEPASLAILGLGLLGLAGARRRRA